MKRKKLIAGVLALQCLMGMPLLAETVQNTTKPVTENKVVTPAVDRENIYQVAELNALMLGNYDGFITVDELLKHGDTGLGTFHTLDGEMIVLDGAVYKAKSDGSVEKQKGDTLIPFATVTYMDNDLEIKELKDVKNIEEIKKALDDAIAKNKENKNLFYMATIKGDFNMVHVRSVPAQTKPYKPLSEIAATQPEFTYENVPGTIVAIRCPDYVQGINLPGWHLHFISEDKSKGGHLLDASIKVANAQIDYTNNFSMTLPQTADFAKLDLAQNLNQKTQQVEGKVTK